MEKYGLRMHCRKHVEKEREEDKGGENLFRREHVAGTPLTLSSGDDQILLIDQHQIPSYDLKCPEHCGPRTWLYQPWGKIKCRLLLFQYEEDSALCDILYIYIVTLYLKAPT